MSFSVPKNSRKKEVNFDRSSTLRLGAFGPSNNNDNNDNIPTNYHIIIILSGIFHYLAIFTKNPGFSFPVFTTAAAVRTPRKAKNTRTPIGTNISLPPPK